MIIKIIATGATKFERFIKRWGVSFLIGEDVLFDTFGDPLVFMKNIKRFSIDMAKIKYIVLSHDDWDHVAGLWEIIPERKDITVYVCPHFKDEIKKGILSSGAKMVEVRGRMKIKEGIYSTGELSGTSDRRFIYEQALVIDSPERVSVICGCAHPGIVNIIKTASRQSDKKVHSLIGGLHLKDMEDKEVAKLIRYLITQDIKRVVPMHCTGRKAATLIKKSFGSGCVIAKEGDVIILANSE